MTEKEVIETLQDIHDVAECRIKSGDQRGVIYIPPDKLQDFNIAISALEEIQQYRASGTVEQCQKYAEIAKAMIEKNITLGLIEEYMKFEDECVRKGFSFNSLLEAREKQIPHKPTKYQMYCGKCKCGAVFLDKSTRYCGNCGQAIDWSEEQ